MSACEKCWDDAFFRARTTGRSQPQCYLEILKENENNGVVSCTPEEQAGQFWDNIKCRDKR